MNIFLIFQNIKDPSDLTRDSMFSSHEEIIRAWHKDKSPLLDSDPVENLIPVTPPVALLEGTEWPSESPIKGICERFQRY